MKSLPDASSLPVSQPAPARHAGNTEDLEREVLPLNAHAKDERDASQACSMTWTSTSILVALRYFDFSTHGGSSMTRDAKKRRSRCSGRQGWNFESLLRMRSSRNVTAS